jgi:hypothetical protein
MRMFRSLKNLKKRMVELELSWDRDFASFSRFLWPWRESRLIIFVIIGAALDYLSTYVAFKFGGDKVSEAGLIAKWGLQTGGFIKLLVIDLGLIGGLLLLSIGVRYLYNKLGLPGYGRAVFVLVLIPYAALILAVIFNNIFVSFLSQQ